MRKLHELEELLESSDNLSPITLGKQKNSISVLQLKYIRVMYNFHARTFSNFSIMKIEIRATKSSETSQKD
jgi:hypothetical protein